MGGGGVASNITCPVTGYEVDDGACLVPIVAEYFSNLCLVN